MLRIILLWFCVSIIFAIGTVIYLHFSRRGDFITIPDLRGSDLPSAEATLKKLGMKVKVTHSTPLTKSLPYGYVLAHFPPGGTKLTRADEVELIVSTGKRKVKVPSIINKTVEEARLVLTKANLQVGYVSYINIPEEIPWVILAQNPLPGSVVDYRDKVHLLVNREITTREVVVPNFVGYKAGVVNKLAKHLGLNLVFLPNYQEEGIVLEQSPEANELLELPGTVTLKLIGGVTLEESIFNSQK
jgi:serine/threonine-protein kinase